ncbi:TPR repeat-containing protein NMB0313 precursor [Gallibacterium anatis]|uniref:TPR repeat-containing protein NMB0313 n=1 Tax=Gallibacterium anatis TaxID=750 RepID=A0A377H5J9_9PAST|nr:surface lipoprotein assembly modifier [Gallibacterium anatis]STO37855.1 TPR repeat-containing protein NMB0313 precursor [Gallibacterium anatis]
MPNLVKKTTKFAFSPIVVGLFPFIFITNSLAAPVTSPTTVIDVKTEPKEYINVAQPDLRSTPKVQPKETATKQDDSREITDEELQQRPELARKLLNYVIDTQRWHLLPDLLEIYKKTRDPDPILIDYAQATLYRVQGNLTGAISLYRHILADNPNFGPVRFALAQALFEDYQTEAAEDQFNKLRASSNLPPEIMAVSEQYLMAIKQQSAWSFSGSLSYLQDDNVNNAAKDKVVYIGNVPFQKSEESLPQSAHGLQYSINLSKKFNLIGRHSLYLENNLYGKSFWDNHEYDDILNRTTVGYQYQDIKNRFAILPFYAYRWFGGEKYSRNYGTRFEYERWLSPKWQTSSAIELSKTKYKENSDADSNSQLYSTTLLHLFNAKTYFYGGVDYQREKAQNRMFSSDRMGFRLGWGQEWKWGLSTRLQFGIEHRNFKEKNLFFNKVRKDKEYNSVFTIWNREWHLWGITPKLNLSWMRVDSNIPALYSYDKNRVFLNFEKTF